MPTPASTCRVVRGDNLWDLAATHLGDPHRWGEIYRLDKGHVQPNGYALKNPDKIDIGWILALPARHPDSGPAGPADTPQASPAGQRQCRPCRSLDKPITRGRRTGR